MRAEPILTSAKTVRIRDHGVPNPQGLETVSVYLGCQRLLRSDAGRQLTLRIRRLDRNSDSGTPYGLSPQVLDRLLPSNSLSGLNTS